MFSFEETLTGLTNGDFTRLDPVFTPDSNGDVPVIRWHKEGRFEAHEAELAEALTCAAFNGRLETVEYLLANGVAPSGGALTGLDAVHWSANRGQTKALQLLLQARAPTETINMYGGTALGATVWSAINEPREAQLEAMEMLLKAGANVRAVEFPTGNSEVDAVLSRYRAQTIS